MINTPISDKRNVTDLLIKSGANVNLGKVNTKIGNGLTSLHLAVYLGKYYQCMK